ncbi:MAG: hypothetical protein PHI37_05795 [Candidatus Gracilibacteria bacterium]|nr:hypothetical protein [Candidatus Gracilibacteria bacterium]
MKEKIKSFFVNVLLVSIISYGIVYGANITTTSQTAVTGDKITAAWVNDVNTKLNNLSTGVSGTVVGGCWQFQGYQGACWGGAIKIATTNTCPSGSTVRGVSGQSNSSDTGGAEIQSFICVKN